MGKEVYILLHFKIFYDIYKKRDILIISYYLNNIIESTKINIYEFKNNKLKLINNFEEHRRYREKEVKFNLIYDDKNLNQYFLLFDNNCTTKIVSLNNLDKIIELLPNIYSDGCIINKNNKDYLCLLSNKYDFEKKIVLFDLYYKEIINEVIIYEFINSMIKYNDNYLILGSGQYIFFYDIINSKMINIINKITLNDEYNEKQNISLKMFKIDENNLI